MDNTTVMETVEAMDRSEAGSEVLGEKRPLENGVDRVTESKKVRRGDDAGGGVNLARSLKKVAEIVLVLDTMGKMRGGRKPTAVEVEMMAEAREKLVDVCMEFAPKDLFPTDAFGTIIDDLGLNKLREQKLGIQSSKLTIAERLLVTKQKMEKAEVLQHQSNLSGPNESHGSLNATRVFPSDKANHAAVSSGSFQNPSNVGTASATNSRTLPYQLPTSEIRPGVSNILPMSQAGRSYFRIDGGANGSPYTSHSQGILAGDAGKTPTWSMPPQSTAFAKIGSDKPPVKTDASSKPFITQATTNPTKANQHRINFNQPTAADPHTEISKIIHKLLHPHALDRPTWTPPSRDYMNKALTCQLCKVTINEVDTALVCDACERGYHLKCLNCNPKAIPRGEWQEWHCAKCLAISNGKPLPPKYGRVMRNVNTPKLSSTSVTVQLPSDKKVISDVNINGSSLSQSGTSSNDGKLTDLPLVENQDSGTTNLIDNKVLTNAPEISSNGKKLVFGSNGVIKKDEQTLTVVGEHNDPTPSSMNEVEWVGGVVKEIDGKTYYNSCRVDGSIYKVTDYAVFSYADNKYLPNKIQAMWEDSKTTKKWVSVTRCFFPDDLPEGVGRPCAPESNEVYESNHETTVVAGLIHGPCEVLPPSKYAEESDKLTRLSSKDGGDGQKTVFLCKWFYDETKRLFRDVTC